MFFLLLPALLGCWSCSAGKEPISFGSMPIETSALIYIAENKHMFSENGLDVHIRDYDTGVAVIDGILKGEVNLASLTEFVVVGKIVQKQRIGILGTLDQSMSTQLIGRKNRGIQKVPDLVGKRVGLARGTIAEFYLGRFLDLHGMKIKDVALVDMTPSKWLDAVATDNVDAVLAWQPYADQLQRRFPNETVAWQVHCGQPSFGLIVGGDDWIAKHPRTIKRFWKSLAQAEEYLIRHPDEAKAIVQKRLGYDDTRMAAVWPLYRFSPSLDESLILAMEDEARWMMKNNLTAEKSVPNFLEYIREDGLKEIKPEVVNIIR